MHPKKKLHMQRRNPDRIAVMNKQKRVRQWLSRVEAQPPEPAQKLDYIERMRYRAQDKIMRPNFKPKTWDKAVA